MDKIKIGLYSLLNSIANAQELVSPHLLKHHQQVAYLSYQIAKEMGLPVEEQRNIFLAGLVHDVGALSKNEKLEIVESESIKVNNHAFVGAKLLQDFGPMYTPAQLIRYHHVPWNHGKGEYFGEEKIDIGSHVIHLADRVCTLIKKEEHILSQTERILQNIGERNYTLFEPKVFQAFSNISKAEYIWLDLISDFPAKRINSEIYDIVELNLDDIVELVRIFSQIIDFRSSFTALHSAGVARIAEQLAKYFNFSPMDCKAMLVAGYLHDLGKLAVDNEILEKPDKLDEEEFNQIRSHTYFTYYLLDSIPEFEQIKEWAAYHHEKIDGTGYPFHIGGDKLCIGSRIMAVADVFTAITEKRPYRDGMDDYQAMKVLRNMVTSGALDGRVVEVLIRNYDEIKYLREKSQDEAKILYEEFLQIGE